MKHDRACLVSVWLVYKFEQLERAKIKLNTQVKDIVRKSQTHLKALCMMYMFQLEQE